MKRIENTSPINTITNLLLEKLPPITSDAQTLSQIVNRINKQKKTLKPWRPQKYCMYPASPRIDDYNFNQGLGQVSLQPTIDKLNSFKEAAINAIKTKFQAMGPEGSKDIKLAAGAADLLKQVLEAAKCYSKIVKNVNNLVSSYINVSNNLVSYTINNINRLESECFQIILFLTTSSELKGYISNELFEKLEKSTDLFEVLSLIEEIDVELFNALQNTKTLLDSKERILLHLQVNLNVLKNRINALKYYSSIRDAVKINVLYAEKSYMTDDFLNNLDVKEIEASSFNWSLTNLAGLYKYNLVDELGLIPKLNKMFSNYQRNKVDPVLIASRNESGYIVVPENEEGLISAGLDSLAGYNVTLAFELSINGGSTIIRSSAKGAVPEESELISKNIGIYYSKETEKIEYNKKLLVETGVWDLYLVDTNVKPLIGEKFIYIDPFTNHPWTFRWEEYNGATFIKSHEFPIILEVLDVTHNYIRVKMLEESDILIDNYLPDRNTSNTFNYINDYTDIPGSYTGDNKLYLKLSTNKYVICEGDSNIPIHYNGRDLTNQDLVGAPAVVNPSIWEYVTGGKTYKIVYTDQNIISLRKYKLYAGNTQSIPHSGEKIPCTNWTLTVYPIGEEEEVRKIKFSREYPGDSIYSFFLKAHWGFIPEEIDIKKKVELDRQKYYKYVAKRIFKWK